MTLEYLIEKYIEKTGYGMDMWSKEENAVMTTVAEIIEESKMKQINNNIEEQIEKDAFKHCKKVKSNAGFNDFIVGAKSNAARNYWFEKFKQEFENAFYNGWLYRGENYTFPIAKKEWLKNLKK